MKIERRLLEAATGIVAPVDFACDQLGLATTDRPNTLSFLDREEFVNVLQDNANITVVLITKELDEALSGTRILRIPCDDPRFYFYTLHNYLAERTYRRTPTTIHPSAVVHPRAYVAEHNVSIAEHCVIEANATILADVVIGAHSIVRAGAVLGAEGFEHKRCARGILSVRHVGRVVLGERVEVGANACIDKGLNERDTVVGDGTKIDNLVHIAHGVHVGNECFIVACAMIAGTVTIDDRAWVGPNANVAPQLQVGADAFISLGSVVTKSVRSGQHVTGNFAIDHAAFITFVKSIAKV